MTDSTTTIRTAEQISAAVECAIGLNINCGGATGVHRVRDAVLVAIEPELTALAALRKVARGYCPECGRGDAAPTVADWEQQKLRADQVEELLRIAHDTSNRAETERARLAAEVQRLGEWCRAMSERAANAEDERDRYHRELTVNETDRVAAASRASDAEATIARVRALAERWRYTGDRKNTALPELVQALTEPAASPATEATGPREHCGDLKPQFSQSTERTECVLRPGHSGSHADHNDTRWWWTDQPDSTSSEEQQ